MALKSQPYFTTPHSTIIMKNIILFSIAIFVFAASLFAQSELRTWTDSSGKKTNAKFIEMKNPSTVTIEREDGRLFDVQLDRLSAADRNYLRNIQTSRSKQTKEELPKNSATSSDTISVTVTGIGKDADAALKDALRAAVEQAVGGLVDAKTLVVNDKLIEDKILTFSGGFVQTYKQQSEPKTREDGLISVRINADVKRGDLDEKLRETGLTKKSLDGDGLFAERFTKMQSLEDGIDMLKWIIEEYMLNCITVKAGETRWDQEKRKVVLEIHTSVDYEKYSAFIKQFIDVLKKMGVKNDGECVLPLERITISPTDYGILWKDIGKYATNYQHPATQIGERNLNKKTKVQDRSFYIATTRWREFTVMGAKKQEKFGRYRPSSEVFDEIRNSLIKMKSKNIVIELLDDESKIVAKDKVLSSCPCYVDSQSDEPGILLFPSLFKNGYTGQFLHWGKIIPKFYPGTPEYKEEIELDIPLDDMKKIRSIQFRYE